MYFVKVLSKKLLQPTGSSDNSLFRLTMAYDGSGRRISKTRWVKNASSQDWEKELVTHYTGIGTEVRENYAGPAKETKVVVNMPQGLGRYGIEDAEKPDFGGRTGDQLAGYIPNVKFEWYLKNHLGSTMLVYGTEGNATSDPFRVSAPLAAYDYRAFGEMVELTPPPTGKVTENFTGKEHDDEIALDYFGARYLDPMLGMWISVDPAKQHFSSYVYASNNPIVRLDPNGLEDIYLLRGSAYYTKPEPHLLFPYGEWSERLNSAIETMKSKGYSVFVGKANEKNFAKLVGDSEAKRAFYHGHIRGNKSGKPDALSLYNTSAETKAVEARHFGNYSNKSVELYLFGCNSKSLENSEWDSVFPNIVGNANEPIKSSENAEQFFHAVEDYANSLPKKEIRTGE